MWSEVEARQGAYDWSGYDPASTACKRARHRDRAHALLDARLGERRRGTNCAPTSGATFATFARRTALHYPFVRRWLIWNEPNQRRWLQPTDAGDLRRRRCSTRRTRRSTRRDPGALVAGGVTAPRAATGGVSPVAWIDGMAAARAHLDAYAHNPYSLNKAETPFTGGCDHCDTITMSTLDRLDATRQPARSARASASG